MASISKHGSTRRLYVCLPDGRRATFYLGKVPLQEAAASKATREKAEATWLA